MEETNFLYDNYEYSFLIWLIVYLIRWVLKMDWLVQLG